MPCIMLGLAPNPTRPPGPKHVGHVRSHRASRGTRCERLCAHRMKGPRCCGGSERPKPPNRRTIGVQHWLMGHCIDAHAHAGIDAAQSNFALRQKSTGLSPKFKSCGHRPAPRRQKTTSSMAALGRPWGRPRQSRRLEPRTLPQLRQPAAALAPKPCCVYKAAVGSDRTKPAGKLPQLGEASF